MSLQNVQQIKKPIYVKNRLGRIFPKLATLIAGALAVGSANAAEGDGVAQLYTKVSTDLGGVSTGTLSVIIILAGVTALLIGWSYLRRTR